MLSLHNKNSLKNEVFLWKFLQPLKIFSFVARKIIAMNCKNCRADGCGTSSLPVFTHLKHSRWENTSGFWKLTLPFVSIWLIRHSAAYLEHQNSSAQPSWVPLTKACCRGAEVGVCDCMWALIWIYVLKYIIIYNVKPKCYKNACKTKCTHTKCY